MIIMDDKDALGIYLKNGVSTLRANRTRLPVKTPKEKSNTSLGSKNTFRKLKHQAENVI